MKPKSYREDPVRSQAIVVMHTAYTDHHNEQESPPCIRPNDRSRQCSQSPNGKFSALHAGPVDRLTSSKRWSRGRRNRPWNARHELYPQSTE